MVFWEGEGARWGFPGLACWDLLGWLDRFGFLDAVSFWALLGRVCMVKFVGSGLLGRFFLGQVYWVKFARSGFLTQVC